MKSMRISLIAAAMLASASAHGAASARTLDIYFIDVEGGQATLIVTPQGETLLIDTGFATGSSPSMPGAAVTSHASRIADAARAAGAKQIDYLLITHFHADHDGGVPELSQLMPITAFIDHGMLAEAERTAPQAMQPFKAYAAVRSQGRHIEPSPGDRLALRGIDVTVVSSAAATLPAPLAGAGERNSVCGTRPAHDPGENARSTGVVITWGKFRFLDLGDLTGRPLYDLCLLYTSDAADE